jgi:hypothetical protein
MLQSGAGHALANAAVADELTLEPPEAPAKSAGVYSSRNGFLSR